MWSPCFYIESTHPTIESKRKPMISAQEALKLLKEGNKRHASGLGGRRSRTTNRHRRELILGQQPFAVVVGCADSRVAPELVFDQGSGDLFVIRVAGNIITPTQAGSIEFATMVLNTKLVVVLGHSQCGAVRAAVDQLNAESTSLPPNLQSIIDHMCANLSNQGITSVKDAEVANIRSGMEAIAEFAPEDVEILGAKYDIGTGRVEYLEN